MLLLALLGKVGIAIFPLAIIISLGVLGKNAERPPPKCSDYYFVVHESC